MKFNPEKHYLRKKPCRKCCSHIFYKSGSGCADCSRRYARVYRQANIEQVQQAGRDRFYISTGRCPITKQPL